MNIRSIGTHIFNAHVVEQTHNNLLSQLLHLPGEADIFSCKHDLLKIHLFSKEQLCLLTVINNLVIDPFGMISAAIHTR